MDLDPEQQKLAQDVALAVILESVAELKRDGVEITFEALKQSPSARLIQRTAELVDSGEDQPNLYGAEADPRANRSHPSLPDSSLETHLKPLLREDYEPEAKFVAGLKSSNLARSYLNQRQYGLAKKIYLLTAQHLLGRGFPAYTLDGFGVEIESYRSLSQECCFLLMSCCQGLADGAFLSHPGDLQSVLAWLYETHVIAKNLWDRADGSVIRPVWERFRGSTPPMIAKNLISCLDKQALYFGFLGNTASYQYCVKLAGEYYISLRQQLSREQVLLMNLPSLYASLRQDEQYIRNMRHPEPTDDHRYQIVHPDLQVRGAWRKLPMKVDEPTTCTRTYGAAFIWNGYLYAVGGLSQNGKPRQIIPHDLRRLSLSQLDKWEVVAKFPPSRLGGVAANLRHITQVPVYKDKLYLFWGNPVVDVFDLKTNKWTILKTVFKATTADQRLGIDPHWPWPKKAITCAAQQIANDRFYVFGGITVTNFLGSNLLMELNLTTLKWRRLSGLPWLTETPRSREPGPRQSCASWINKDKKKLYIFSGLCCRARPMWEMKYGPPGSWTYDDLWSWDIEGEKWREERMVGNPPAPRIASGYVFSQKLNKAIVFGGANSMCPTIVGDSNIVGSAFYADTFMYSPPDPHPASPPAAASATQNADPCKVGWKQIQTCGFPTYRWEHSLMEDPDTGHIYLYGGEVRGETLPTKRLTEAQRSKRATYETSWAEDLAATPAITEALGLEEMGEKTLTRYFADIWQLHIDIPGGDFQRINMEDELRTAPLGPWQRCFECRKTGFWKKCGGSCGGKAFFCGQSCQTKGWKEHKRFHECKKLGQSGKGKQVSAKK